MVHGFAKTKPSLSLRHFVLQWENILTGTTSSLAWSLQDTTTQPHTLLASSSLAWSLQDTTTQPHTLLASWIWTMLSCSIKIYLVLVYFNPIESRFLISLSYIITLLFNIFSYNWKLNKPCSKIILCTQQLQSIKKKILNHDVAL